MTAGGQAGEAYQAWLWQQLEAYADSTSCLSPDKSQDTEQWRQEAHSITATQVLALVLLMLPDQLIESML